MAAAIAADMEATAAAVIKSYPHHGVFSAGRLQKA